MCLFVGLFLGITSELIKMKSLSGNMPVKVEGLPLFDQLLLIPAPLSPPKAVTSPL